jgi:pilus assembly protein Flp/PilA
VKGAQSRQEGHMKRSLWKFWQDESGATAIEYALIAAGIALAIIVIINGLGAHLAEMLSSLNTMLK